MLTKSPIHPDRIRKVPKQFSWIDGRLVRDGHLDGCSHPAAALYLFLITVSDTKGLSYYSDHSICKRLQMDTCLLSATRLELIRLSLIAYRKPLYQVLDLTPQEVVYPRNSPQDPMQPLGQVLQQIMEGRP
jgi:hypothetical protein